MTTPTMPTPPTSPGGASSTNGRGARAPRASAFWERARRYRPSALAIITVGLSAFIATASPFTELDERTRSWALGVTAPSTQSKRVIVLEISPEELRSDACDRALPEAIKSGHAKGMLLPPPLDAWCKVKEGSGITWLPKTALLTDSTDPTSTGEVMGFDVDAPHLETARSFGLTSARWVARRARGAVPAVELGAIEAGRVSATVLADRVVVGALSVKGAGYGFEHRVADAIAGALDGDIRHEAPRWTAPLLPVPALIAAFMIQKRAGGKRSIILLSAALFLAVLLHLLFAKVGVGLWPLASILVAIMVGFGGILLSAARNWYQTVRGTSDLLRTAHVTRTVGSVPLDREALWSTIASLATEAHPAERVLVAEHDPEMHTLHFHDLPDEAEIIADPERDPRRPPFRGDDGLMMVRVAHSFLREGAGPAVLVPLTAHGLLQGYVALTGEIAVRAYEEDPSRVQILGDELGLLIHRTCSSEEDIDLIEAQNRPTKLDHLTANARSLAEHAGFLSEVIHALPMGIAWADERGRIRIVNKRLSNLLATVGINVPVELVQGVLPPDNLSLTGLITRLTSEEKVDLVRAMRGRGIGATVVLGDPPTTHHMTVRAQRQRGPGSRPITGYIVVLAPEGELTFPDITSVPPGVDSGAPPSPVRVSQPTVIQSSVSPQVARQIASGQVANPAVFAPGTFVVETKLSPDSSSHAHGGAGTHTMVIQTTITQIVPAPQSAPKEAETHVRQERESHVGLTASTPRPEESHREPVTQPNGAHANGAQGNGADSKDTYVTSDESVTVPPPVRQDPPPSVGSGVKRDRRSRRTARGTASPGDQSRSSRGPR